MTFGNNGFNSRPKPSLVMPIERLQQERVRIRNAGTLIENNKIHKSIKWCSGNAFVSGAVGPRFKYRASQIGHK